MLHTESINLHVFFCLMSIYKIYNGFMCHKNTVSEIMSWLVEAYWQIYTSGTGSLVQDIGVSSVQCQFITRANDTWSWIVHLGAKCESKYKSYLSRKIWLKCSMQNAIYFVRVPLCWSSRVLISEKGRKIRNESTILYRRILHCENMHKMIISQHSWSTMLPDKRLIDSIHGYRCGGLLDGSGWK